VVAINDLQLHDGLRFPDATPRVARVRAERTGRLVACRLVADFHNRRGQLVHPDRLHATAIVELADRALALAQADAVGPVTKWHKVWYPEPTALMYHGPAFQSLVECAFTESGEVWGKVVAAPLQRLAGPRPATGWHLHPALLDAGLYLCGITVWQREDQALALPKGLDRLRLGRLPGPGEKCLVHLRPIGSNDRERVFDFVGYGEDGAVLFVAEGYRCQIVLKSLPKSKLGSAGH
jgi:hypothetical protein